MRTQVYKYGVICEKPSQQEYSDTTVERARIIDDFFNIVAKIQYIITTLLTKTFVGVSDRKNIIFF
jgi:hypothetical protein